MNNLTLACENLPAKADWLLDYYPDLPNKTCADSVSDIFAFGNELVETLRISRDAVASFDVAGETVRRYQALSFLRSWLVKLTKTVQCAAVGWLLGRGPRESHDADSALQLCQGNRACDGAPQHLLGPSHRGEREPRRLLQGPPDQCACREHVVHRKHELRARDARKGTRNRHRTGQQTDHGRA